MEITVAGHDLTIHQSPSVLSSSRAGGTTGAVLWKITPVFADWLSRPDNVLFTSGVLGPQSAVIELGCGIAAMVGLLLASKVSRYVLTDQPYVAKLVEQNLEGNRDAVFGQSTGQGGKTSRGRKTKTSSTSFPTTNSNLSFTPLDWETDAVTSSLTGSSVVSSFDAIMACDCIYNEALIEPFVSTCIDICNLRAADDTTTTPCLCIVGQHLRDSDVFESFMARFARDFDLWRVPDSQLVEGLRVGDGFAVTVGVLKGSVS